MTTPTFEDIVLLADEEKRIHPRPWHDREVDGALNALRSKIAAHRVSAEVARANGRNVEAEHAAAAASRALEEAGPLFQARLETAKAARAHEDDKAREAARQTSIALRTGGGQPHRDPAVLEAMRVARLRLEALGQRMGGSEADFGERLDEIESAAQSLLSSVGIARREARIRVAAARADIAVVEYAASKAKIAEPSRALVESTAPAAAPVHTDAIAALDSGLAALSVAITRIAA